MLILDLQRLRTRRDEILACAADHGARNVRVFEQPDDFVTDVEKATEANLRGVSR